MTIHYFPKDDPFEIKSITQFKRNIQILDNAVQVRWVISDVGTEQQMVEGLASATQHYLRQRTLSNLKNLDTLAGSAKPSPEIEGFLFENQNGKAAQFVWISVPTIKVGRGSKTFLIKLNLESTAQVGSWIAQVNTTEFDGSLTKSSKNKLIDRALGAGRWEQKKTGL